MTSQFPVDVTLLSSTVILHPHNLGVQKYVDKLRLQMLTVLR